MDERGKPVPDVPVTVEIERQEVTATRVKGSGDAYLTQYNREWKKVSTCKGKSDNDPEECEFVPKEPGYYRFIGTISDTQGKQHEVQIHGYVVGAGVMIWEQPDDASLNLVPEATSYKVGDKARVLVKNPFPKTEALVTIERYGVIKQWTMTLETATPIIEFDIEPDFLPGFYLSVVVMSPRVKEKGGFDTLDLGKPTFRIGYVKMDVNDPYKQITVAVEPKLEVYRPRDKATVAIDVKVANKDSNNTDEPIELAVAVLDEAVFDLIQGGLDYFSPYKGFYELEDLDLVNYNLVHLLIGRQKIEKKGDNPGGDGGDDVKMRELFKFVAYWNPSLPAKDGGTDIEFELPDNLTGWRVLVMATTPSDRFGLGWKTFKVNRPTELRPVMPNQIAEGDSFRAKFSAMNRTDEKRRLDVEVSATGAVKDKPSLKTSVELEARQKDRRAGR